MDRHYDTATLIDYLHGALDDEADAAVFAHLAACDACRAEYDAELDLTELLRAAARNDSLEMPADLAASIRLAAHAQSAPAGFLARLTTRRAAWALPAAAMLAVAIWYGAADLRNRAEAPTASIDARYYLEAHAAQTLTIPDGVRSGTIALRPSAPQTHIDAAFVRATDPVLGDMTPGLGVGGPTN
ncbi:MAG TPA: zf-HC2 domain-containing protein [Candidatus Dormibacteraeota bacterium]|nr:zf-HC2 domain-containing protein [Candidatus Dormibacteraeota bacterium]